MDGGLQDYPRAAKHCFLGAPNCLRHLGSYRVLQVYAPSVYHLTSQPWLIHRRPTGSTECWRTSANALGRRLNSNVGSAHLVQQQEPEPSTFGFSFTALGESPAEASASTSNKETPSTARINSHLPQRARSNAAPPLSPINISPYNFSSYNFSRGEFQGYFIYGHLNHVPFAGPAVWAVGELVQAKTVDRPPVLQAEGETAHDVRSATP